MKFNLIIADDHRMFLDGVLSILNSEKKFNILLTANSGDNIVKYLTINPSQRVDLIITDIRMPKMNGVMLNNKVKEMGRNIKTLIVSMHKDPDIIDTLIEANVDGYIQKNAKKEELLSAIKHILSGKKYFSQEVKDVYVDGKFSQKQEQKVRLTKREIDVITLIAQEYTTQEIADKLFLSKHTIESYRKNLISKLNVRNLAGLTKYALKMKYVES